ncbi:MAG: hypothetical protein AAGB51_06620 [Planctomycetota bacterium]
MDHRSIVSASCSALEEAQRCADYEQAVRGIESLDAKAITQIVRDGLVLSGLGVLRDERYPGSGARGPRCDLVIGPEPGFRLGAGDPAEALGLFEPTAACVLAPEEALWIECRVVGSVVDNTGAAGRRALPACVSDVQRLAEEGEVSDGGLLVIHFAAHDEVARADRDGLVSAMLDAGLPVGPIEHERFEISDRLGVTVCSVWLLPVRTG